MTNATPMEPNKTKPDGLNVISENKGEENKPKKKRRRNRRKRKNINVRTLFVGGLPMDTKPREIYLMFRKFSGYQGSILKLHGKEGKTASPVAFVTFVNREQAEAAKLELHGVRFDELIPRTLKIEFAKSNTKDATKAITTPPTVIVPSDSPAIESQTAPLCDTTTGLLTTNDSTWSQNNTMMTDVNGNVVYPSFIPNPAVATNEESSPCTTLFVANLGHNASEEEIKQLFVRIPSFRRIKMYKSKGTKPVAFVQYCDVTSAIQAKKLFSGQMLLSSENGGIRIEFAKKPMGDFL